MNAIRSTSFPSARAPRRAVVATLAGLVALLAGVVPALPAGAQDPPADGENCLPAGGIDVPFDTDPDDVAPDDVLVVNGGGFGHGVGMSQYGARGAAVAGCTYPTILKTYYPGTEVAPWPSPDVVRIGLRRTPNLSDHAYVITAASAGGLDVTWHLCHYQAETCDQPASATQTAADSLDRTWYVRGDAATNEWVLERADGAGARVEVFRGGNLVEDVLQARHEGTVTRYSPTDLKNKWGFTQFDWTSGSGGQMFVTEHITGGVDPHTGDEGSAVERYLWGLAEVPIGWPAETLKTQAVAGRSYALSKIATAAAVGGPDGFSDCRCDLRPTTIDQHWIGFTHEYADRQRSHPWRKAVQATAGEALTFDHDGNAATPARIADTFYSSSHGGSSDDVRHVWGSSISYLQAVDTSRWECLGEDPNQRWTVAFTAAELASKLGFDEVTEVTVEARGPGGRPTRLDVNEDGKKPDGVIVTGVRNGETTQKRFSGEGIRFSKGGLGLRSGLVHFSWVTAEPTPDPSPSPSPTASEGSRAASTASDTPCAPDDPADPPAPVVPERVAGENRVQTAAAVARLGWDSSPVVVIARSDHPADALAGSALAGKLGAPLLINPTAGLSPEVESVVNDLGATSAVLLGGEAALSRDVELQLLDRTTVDTVDRAAGDTRYDTAIDIANRLAPAEGGSAFLVRGRYEGAPQREWPDALAVSGLAAHRAADGQPWPVLLTGAALPQRTEDALAALKPQTVYVVGGVATVPQAVEDRLVELGYEVVRIAGEDRYGTSRASLQQDVVTEQILVLATARDFPDGLAAGPLAAKLDARLLLVPATYDASRSPWLEAQHPDAVRALGWTEGQVVAVGGTAAISDEVATAIRDALGR